MLGGQGWGQGPCTFPEAAVWGLVALFLVRLLCTSTVRGTREQDFSVLPLTVKVTHACGGSSEDLCRRTRKDTVTLN